MKKVLTVLGLALVMLALIVLFTMRQASAAGADPFTPGGGSTVRKFAAPASGIAFPTNAVASWPTNAATPGGCLLVMSNHVLYVLSSSPGSRTWAHTNAVTTP
jgi:hypothetical protein